MRGIVVDFDAHVGLGTVETETKQRYLFHCTQIADGTRNIAVDTPVEFEVRERHKGPEAYAITPA